MIIAKLPLRALPKPLPALRRISRRSIEIHAENVPLGATCWITCMDAFPHMDPSWPNKLFVTLTVEGEHQVGDSERTRQRSDSTYLLPGYICVIDPTTPHWLLREGRAKRWIGLQWEISRKQACKQTRAIVDGLGAHWEDVRDTRYRRWPVWSRPIDRYRRPF